jgi:hypothetical protein
VLYVFGGIVGLGFDSHSVDDLWAFDLQQERWQQVGHAPSAAWPASRLGHGLLYDELGDQCVLYGGQSATLDPAGTQVRFLTDVWTYDLSSGVWTERAPRGPTPAARIDMSWIALPGAAVLIGGVNLEGQVRYQLNNFVLDLQRWRWIPLPDHNARSTWYEPGDPAAAGPFFEAISGHVGVAVVGPGNTLKQRLRTSSLYVAGGAFQNPFDRSLAPNDDLWRFSLLDTGIDKPL